MRFTHIHKLVWVWDVVAMQTIKRNERTKIYNLMALKNTLNEI